MASKPKPSSKKPAAEFRELRFLGESKAFPSNWSFVPANYHGMNGTLDLEPLAQSPSWPKKLVFTTTAGQDIEIETSGVVLPAGHEKWGERWTTKITVPERNPRQKFANFVLLRRPGIREWLKLSDEKFWEALNKLDVSTEQGQQYREAILMMWAADRATLQLEANGPTARDIDALLTGAIEDGMFVGMTGAARHAQVWLSPRTPYEEMNLAYAEMYVQALIGTTESPGYAKDYGNAGMIAGLGAGVVSLFLGGAAVRGAGAVAVGTAGATRLFAGLTIETVALRATQVAIVGPAALVPSNLAMGLRATKPILTSALVDVPVACGASAGTLSFIPYARAGDLVPTEETKQIMLEQAKWGCIFGAAFAGGGTVRAVGGAAKRAVWPSSPPPTPSVPSAPAAAPAR